MVFSLIFLFGFSLQAMAQEKMAVPLTWSRSSSFISGPVGEVVAALALPTDIAIPAQVWDRGEWAYWSGPVECSFPTSPAWTRNFKTTFTITQSMLDSSATIARLYDPFAESLHKDGAIPINDALYLYVNGQFIIKRSASYGTALPGYGTPGIDSFPGGPVGWYITAISFPVNLLKVGGNTINVVGEDTCDAGGLGFLALELVIPFLSIQIDIKPDSFPNSVNPNSEGVIPISILSTADFNANTIDQSSVRFGVKGTESVMKHFAYEDVNKDGKMDIIFHFKTQDTGIICGSESAALTGKTISGKIIKGTDSVKTVGCK